MSVLPHYSRYSRTRMVELTTVDPIKKLIASDFQRTLTRHRGPAQGDPHRLKPELEVVRVERIFAPRMQEKYLAELQDVAGLCEQKVKPLEGVDALRVESFEGLKMNEFLMYHGAPSVRLPMGVVQRPRGAAGHGVGRREECPPPPCHIRGLLHHARQQARARLRRLGV